MLNAAMEFLQMTLQERIWLRMLLRKKLFPETPLLKIQVTNDNIATKIYVGKFQITSYGCKNVSLPKSIPSILKQALMRRGMAMAHCQCECPLLIIML